MPKETPHFDAVSRADLEARLGPEIEGLKASQDTQREYLVGQIESLETKLRDLIAEGEKKTQSVDGKADQIKQDLDIAKQEQEQSLEGAKTGLQQDLLALIGRFEALENRLPEEFEQIRNELPPIEAKIYEETKTLTEAFDKFRVECLGWIETTQEETKAWEKVQEQRNGEFEIEIDRRLKDWNAKVEVWQGEIEARLRRQHEAFEAEWSDYQRTLDELFTEKHEEQKEFTESIQVQFEKLRDLIERDMSAATANFEERTSGFKDTCETYMQATTSNVHSWHNRNMNWQIRQVREKLRNRVIREGQSVLSPEFCFCEQWLVLELLVQAAVPRQDRSPGDPVSAPMPGGASIRVWAPPGVKMIFTLSIGVGPSRIVTGRLEHHFKAPLDGSTSVLDEKSRVGFLTQNLCTLDQVWVKKDNTVDVGIELLEMHFPSGKADDFAVRPPLEIPAGDNPMLRKYHSKECQVTLLDDSTILAAEAEARRAEEEAQRKAQEEYEATLPEEERRLIRRRRRKAERQKEAELAAEVERREQRELADQEKADIERNTYDMYGNKIDGPLKPDWVEFERHVAGMATLRDKFAGELLTLRNRGVRRVEWRLENCSMLVAHCKPGDSVESPCFSAAGVEQLKLFMYPAGRDSGKSEGPVTQQCSVYVSAPASVLLQGTISVGTITRRFEHRCGEAGSLGGCPALGVLERQIDCENCVDVALELTEVDIDLPEHSGLLCIRGTSFTSTSPDSASASPVTSTRSLPSPKPDDIPKVPVANGTVKMRRRDPKSTEELVKSSSTPELNLRKQHLPVLMKQIHRNAGMM